MALLVPATVFLTVLLLQVLLLAGAYVICVRNLWHCPRELRLRRKGLDSLLEGRPVEAENHFRRSFAMAVDAPDRVRGLVCLGDALMDQGRYEESKAYLLRALELGDPTGSGQGSMADLLLTTGTDPEQALEMAEQAMRLLTSRSTHLYFDRQVTNDLTLSKYWARRASALAQLDRHTEARQAIERASRIAEAAQIESQHTKNRIPISRKIVLGGSRLAHGRDLTLATTHWRIGLALLAIDDSSRAAEHFRITRDTDRRGKYRRLAEQQLEHLEAQH